MSDLVCYEKPVVLDRDKHRRRRIRPGASFAFARKASSLYLAGAEFAEACKEYAIVFTRGGSGRVIPVVMLGLRERKNLYVDDAGSWRGRHGELHLVSMHLLSLSNMQQLVDRWRSAGVPAAPGPGS